MRKYFGQVLILLFVVVFVMAAAGCGSGGPEGVPGGGSLPESPPTDTGRPESDNDPNADSGTGPGEDARPLFGERYSIRSIVGDSQEERVWVVDRDGATVPEDKQYTILCDVLTGEPQCMTLSKPVSKGRDENGNAMTYIISALFDLDGNMLYDWGEYLYYSGFGDFVIRQNTKEQTITGYPFDLYSELWDFKANRPVVSGVGQVFRLSDDKVLVVYGDDWNEGRPLCVMDAKGAVLDDIYTGEEYTTAWVWGGYIIATDGENSAGYSGQQYLLTEEFKPICSYTTLIGSKDGKVLAYGNGPGFGEPGGGIITPDGKEVYKIPSDERVLNFDKEILVTGYDHDDENYTYKQYKIVRTGDGKVLRDGIEKIPEALYFDSRKMPENLPVYKDGCLEVIDREGQVKAQKEMPGVESFSMWENGYVQFTAETGEQDENGYNLTGTGLLDQDLREAIPFGAYDDIRAIRPWDTDFGIRIGERYKGSWPRRVCDCDLLDLEGKVLIRGLNEIDEGEAGYDRIVVRKGFDVGLMDWHGNWIYKRSIFAGLQD